MPVYKPMLAVDYNGGEIKFPIIVEPKIDGVRGLCYNGLKGRSLKKFANKAVSRFYSHPVLDFLDGEFVANEPTSPSLCRDTVSVLNTIEGPMEVNWYVFDYFKEPELPYETRLQLLTVLLHKVTSSIPQFEDRLRVIPWELVRTRSRLEELEEQYLEDGFEGLIYRDPRSPYKFGRSTIRESGLVRIKRFDFIRATVVGMVEGQTNNNEATTNELGYISRSTHQENMEPNGMIGTLICSVKGREEMVSVSPGRLTHDQRELYLRNPDKILGREIVVKTFPIGVKDKLRMPTFQEFV